jgi:SAM-dependent methyltransferase
MSASDPTAANRAHWNARVPYHLASAMYDVEGFVAGNRSLSTLEDDLLGDVRGLRVLHLQCHFGKDTLELARRGAHATGLDFSEAAVAAAEALAARCGLAARFVCDDVRTPRPEWFGQFDVVFTSFGVMGWLPDLTPWAANVARYLAPGGRFVFAEFHPAVWMFDNDFDHLAYSYFNRETIVEEESGTYADRDAPIRHTSYGWNHDLGEVLTALLGQGLRLERFVERDGSPHDCFAHSVRGDDGLYRIAHLAGKLPMVFGLTAVR